jgi:hypothetical protein
MPVLRGREVRQGEGDSITECKILRRPYLLRAISAVVGFGALLANVALTLDAACAQTGSNGILTDGNPVVTGFSGTQLLGSASVDKIFIDPHGPSLRIIDLQTLGALPQAQLFAASKPFAVTAAQVGQVFGVALDSATPPNVFVATTSAYR